MQLRPMHLTLSGVFCLVQQQTTLKTIALGISLNLSRLALSYSTSSSVAALGVLLFLTACGPASTSQADPHPPAAAPTVSTERPLTRTPVPSNGSGGVTAATGPQVTLNNFTFTPQTITVKSGTTVTWVNHDDTPHTVTSADHLFGSSALDTDDQFTYRFSATGTFQYFCTIHPRMTATVIVQ